MKSTTDTPSGMDASRLQHLMAVMKDDIEQDRYFGGVIALGRHGQLALHEAIGAVWTLVDACSTEGSRHIDDIGVMVEVDHENLTGVIGSNRLIRERTVLRLEPLPTTQCPT